MIDPKATIRGRKPPEILQRLADALPAAGPLASLLEDAAAEIADKHGWALGLCDESMLWRIQVSHLRKHCTPEARNEVPVGLRNWPDWVARQDYEVEQATAFILAKDANDAKALVLIERLNAMSDRRTRDGYSIGDYWNVCEEAADVLAGSCRPEHSNLVGYARADCTAQVPDLPAKTT